MNIQDLEKVHTTGFDLEDVKVTFNHDVKVKVSATLVQHNVRAIDIKHAQAAVHGQIQELIQMEMVSTDNAKIQHAIMRQQFVIP